MRVLVLFGIVAVGALLVLLLLQLPSTQARVLHLIQNRLERSSGLQLDAEGFGYRIFPGTIHMERARVSDSEGRHLSAASLEIYWSYSGLLASPPRLSSVKITGLVFDPLALPHAKPNTRAPGKTDPWEILQIEKFELQSSGTQATWPELSVQLEDVQLDAFLLGNRLGLQGSAKRLQLLRSNRLLDLGSLQVDISGERPHVLLRKLGNNAQTLRVELQAEFRNSPHPGLGGTAELSLDPGFLLHWWDPSLTEQLPLEGSAAYSVSFFISQESQLLKMEQQQGSIHFADIPIGFSKVDFDDGKFHFDFGDSSWGEMDGKLMAQGELSLRGHFSGLEAASLLDLPGPLPSRLRDEFQQARISGDFDLGSTLPPSLDTVQGNADLKLSWPSGTAQIRSTFDDGELHISDASLNSRAALLSLKGDIADHLHLHGSLKINDPTKFANFIPAAASIPIGGGPLGADFKASGSLQNPIIEVEVRWTAPQIFNQTLDEVVFRASGPGRDLNWQLETRKNSAQLTASGRASWPTAHLEGHWTFAGLDLKSVPEALQPLALEGRIDGNGAFELSSAQWQTQSTLEGRELKIGALELPKAIVELEANPEFIKISRADLQALGGSLQASGFFSPTDSTLKLDLNFDALRPEFLPIENVPAGEISGAIHLSGLLENPGGEARLSFSSQGIIRTAHLFAKLEDGRILLNSEELESAPGPLVLKADLPLGDLNTPAGLWPKAPGGPWEFHLVGASLHLAPLLEMAGRPDLPLDGMADLDLAVQWHPALGGFPQIQAEIDNLVLKTPVENFHATRPFRLAFDGVEAVLGESSISGSHGGLTLDGRINIQTREIEARLEGSLAPSLARLSPLSFSMDSPMEAEISIEGTIDAPRGHLKLHQGEGLISLREPPLQLENLRLEASFADGVLDLDEGHARINGGEADLGGGWDPTFGQGLVAEFENLSFLLPNDILSRWDGVVSLEPAGDGLATLVGDLDLLQGLWQAPFDLSSGSGDQDSGTEASDTARLFHLDLEVHGRGGIHVDNNLGRFDLQWNTLQITGNAEDPKIIGDINFLPGGTLNLPGKQLKIRRGMAQFTGDPLVDPLLEIVPETSNADVLGSPSSLTSEHEASGLATAGLSSGISAFLGISNTSIRPEDIAADTETDTSTEFSIGQQLGQSMALFLTTDLRDSQRRTTLFQVWQIPYLPDLTVQAQTRTDTGESDIKLLKRFRWGGTRNTSPQLEKVHFDGRWPISRFRRLKAAGLRPGQSWDPFLLFVARVRLEKALAKRGYPEARVHARIGKDMDHPSLRLSCEPGAKIDIRFSGDSLSRKLKALSRGLYRFPPQEESALEDIRSLLERQLWAEAYPNARIFFEKDGEQLTITVNRGRKIILEGPVIEGVPPEVRANLRRLISTPAELAAIRRDPGRAADTVQRTLAYAGFRQPGPVDVIIKKTSPDSAKLYLSIDPGPLAHLSEIVLDGEDPLDLLHSPASKLKENMVLNRNIIDQEISRLRRGYRREGYTEVRARAYLEEVSPQSWRLRLSLEPGAPQKIKEIRFHGLRWIRKKYLRNKLSLKTGAVFLLQKLDESLARLSRFSPVERVDAKIRHTSEGVIVDLGIQEVQRWILELGGGWNSDRGLALRLGFRDDNLLGRGIKAAFRSRWERDFKQARFLLTLPPLPGGHFALGLNSSYTEDYLAAEEAGDLQLRQNTGQTTVDATWQLKHRVFLRGYYRFTRTHLFEANPVDPWFPVNINRDLGELGSQLILDHLDDPFDPHTGAYLGLDLSWAGDVLGSDTENVRSLLSASLAISTHRNWTWFQSFRLGAAHPLSGVLDPNSRFFAGGPSTIRGFKRDSVGPIEILGDQSFYVGGGVMMIINEELRFPLWSSLRGAVFVDGGQVWKDWSTVDGRFSVGAGVGIRWTTPIGPLWGDVAWPVAHRGTNSGPRFSFGIGRTF